LNVLCEKWQAVLAVCCFSFSVRDECDWFSEDDTWKQYCLQQTDTVH